MLKKITMQKGRDHKRWKQNQDVRRKKIMVMKVFNNITGRL